MPPCYKGVTDTYHGISICDLGVYTMSAFHHDLAHTLSYPVAWSGLYGKLEQKRISKL
jgi:hypothetical protein